MLASIAVAVVLTGCESKNDRETGDVGRDTTITSERVQDTTIVTADTSIDVDTVSTTDNIDRAKE
ncbi:MAG: hypothetical protein H0T50_05415 [Gemmatimonadales bacterium]|nr:hypothetical protein [Gemmatimonadales bacterium]